jgi:3-hydroxyisobutyrate dehydrogenase-like beta-hydroxyacid dehydrogenase
MTMKVGFIGLGQMGAGMAAVLIKVGHELTIYNGTRSKEKALLERGAMRQSSSPMRAGAMRYACPCHWQTFCVTGF